MIVSYVKESELQGQKSQTLHMHNGSGFLIFPKQTMAIEFDKEMYELKIIVKDR